MTLFVAGQKLKIIVKNCLPLIFLIGAVFISEAQNLIKGEPPEGEIVYYCSPCGCQHDEGFFLNGGQCPSCNMMLRPMIPGLEMETSNTKIPTVGVFLFNMADVMDVSGPVSVFEHASFNIVTFAKSKEPVRIGMNLELKPDFTIETLPEVDILVLPGGGMAESNPGDEAIVSFIKERFEKTEVLFSVCSGAFFLGESGVLDGQRATTFASLIPELTENYPEAIVLNDVKYTDNGKVVTSAGLSSGIDAAFQVVSKYYGVGRAQDIANHMEYPWKRESDYARSQLADNFISTLQSIVSIFSTNYYYSQGDHDYWEFRHVISNQMKPGKIIETIARELEKDPSWATNQSNKLSISGIINHQTLGEAKVMIAIKQDSARGWIAVLTSERVKKFIP